MNFKTIKRFGVLIFVLAAFASCTKLEDTFSEFSKNPETIYIGSPDTLIVQSGYEKLRLSIIINADPKIRKGEVRIGNDTVPQKFTINRKRADIDTTHIDMTLPEGSYRLSVTLLDEADNKSLVKSVLANVLGESYIKTLGVKPITAVDYTKSTDPEKTGALITLGNNYEGLSAVRLKFLNSKGVPVQRIVDRFVPSLVLNDFQAGGEIIAESIYFPVNPFYEFKASGASKAKLPSCNQLSSALASSSLLHFSETESQKTNITSFVLSLKECTLGNVTLSATAPFLLATTANGDFKNTLQLDSISQFKNVFVLFKPLSNKDSVYSGRINIEAKNILSVPFVKLSGKEVFFK